MHTLGLGQPHLDPADGNAYRLLSGAALTADLREAEFALPPLPCRAGTATEIAVAAARERADLAARLPAGMTLSGYSTHVSVSAPDHLTRRAVRRYASTFAPALMLLMDKATSPGLLIRPRPGRIELGGEYVVGSRLVAVVVFAMGSVRACLTAQRSSGTPLPPRVQVRAAHDDRRYGLYVPRHAFGGDLYREGRAAQLMTSTGPVSAQSHLEACWAAARTAVGGDATAEEIALVDGVVHGSMPLPGHLDEEPLRGEPPSSPYGSALAPMTRPGFALAPVMLTWATVVFIVGDAGLRRVAYLCVPGSELDRFVDDLHAGRLDDMICAYFASPPRRGRRLHRLAQTRSLGLYDTLGRRLDLLPRERAPRAGVRAALRRFQRQ